MKGLGESVGNANRKMMPSNMIGSVYHNSDRFKSQTPKIATPAHYFYRSNSVCAKPMYFDENLLPKTRAFC